MESADDVRGGGGGGGEGRRWTLAADLARVQSMVRELEANVDRQDLPPAAREICGELAFRVDRSLRIVNSLGSAAQDAGSAGKNNAHFKRRKGVPSVRKQVRVTSVQGTAAAPDDGFSWRKYGQKDILGAEYPRAYFRCTHRHTQSCLATKQVQRTDGDPLLFDVVYHGAHTCVQAGHHLAGTEQQLHPPEPGHAGQEQGSPRAALEAGGLQAGLFEPATLFASTPVGADGGYPLLSPTSLDWAHLRSSHAAGGLGAGVEFEHHHHHQMEEWWPSPSDSSQWFPDLFLANQF